MKMSPEEKERRKFLRKELREYLKTTETTPDELEALKEWVAEQQKDHGSDADS